MYRKSVLSCAALFALVSANAFAEDLATYVQNCKTALGFTTLPSMNCRDGVLFAPAPNPNPNTDPTNDWVVHARVNDNVDMVAACRWLRPDLPDAKAISLELQVHNRETGQTCFFQARNDQPIPAGDNPNFTIPAQIVPPTASAAQRDQYWMQPAAIDNNGAGVTRCVGCHVAGPYIASGRIAPALAKFGLLNNGHDTFADDTSHVKKYRVVGGGVPGAAFQNWDTLIRDGAYRESCTAACHILGSNSAVTSDVVAFIFTLIPSIHRVINEIGANMPPTEDFSSYRWINHDNPFKAGDAGDSEKFGYAKAQYPWLLRNCGSPGRIDAHAVGTDNSFMYPNPFPDKFAAFNVRDGLRCVNSQQTDGMCNDYQTSYRCPNGTWTTTTNRDLPSTGTGDDESRPTTAICPNNAAPTDIQAQTLSGHGIATAFGPQDRLAKFDLDGLECRNADQPDGKCSNYVVNYSTCSTVPQDFNLVSSWSGRDLTATATTDDAETRAQPDNQAWSSQDWAIEPIQPTAAVNAVGNPRASSFVRLRNVWTNKYLNVQANGEDAKVTTYSLREDWTSMWWLPEPVAGTNDVRFRNVWSGKYLTVVDAGDFSKVLAKTLNTTWPSQRWAINRSFLIGQR